MLALFTYLAAFIVWLGMEVGTCTQGDSGPFFASALYGAILYTPLFVFLQRTEKHWNFLLVLPLALFFFYHLAWSFGLFRTVNLSGCNACAWRNGTGFCSYGRNAYDLVTAPLYIVYDIWFFIVLYRLFHKFRKPIAK